MQNELKNEILLLLKNEILIVIELHNILEIVK